MNQTREKKEHTAAYRIFHYYYKAYIPQHALYSQDFLETFGVPVSGDRQVDRELANTKTLAQLTIAEMAEKLDEGVPVTLEDPKKSVEIYKTLREHLNNWFTTVSNPVGSNAPPVEDLRRLDNLAGEVYKIARHYMKEAPSDSSLFRRLDQLGSNRAVSRHAEPKEERQLPEEHQPIHDAIVKEHFGGGRRWK